MKVLKKAKDFFDKKEGTLQDGTFRIDGFRNNGVSLEDIEAKVNNTSEA